jgi:dolichol-phosphate mannosyltransferase
MIKQLTLKYYRILKFIFSGGLAALISLFVLYAFTAWLGVWYLLSSVIAFIVSSAANFFLQKFWTFGDTDKDGALNQASMFLLVVCLNFALNALLMYLLVDGLRLWYMFSQFFVTATLAVMNYLIYRHIIFRNVDVPNAL